MKAKKMRLSNNKKRKVQQMITRAAQALATGQADLCKGMCLEIERIWPGNPDIANLRGVMHVNAGDATAAEACFKQAIENAPRRSDFHKNLGALYASSGQPESASRMYQAAWDLSPDDVGAALALAQILVELHRTEQAMQTLQRILHSAPHNPDILTAIADIHFHLGNYQNASDYLDTALTVNHNHECALMQKASLLRAQGELSEAGTIARRILGSNPEHVEAALMLSRLKTFSSANDDDLRFLKHIYQSASSDIADRKNACFALGKVMEDIGNYEQAFDYFHEGNEIVCRYANYDLDAELDHIDHIIQHYSADKLLHHSDITDATPIFIVGMPRCGSTLVEQILAAHPDVASRGEWQGFELLLNHMHTQEQPLTIEGITSFSPEQWGKIGYQFLTRLRSNPDNQNKNKISTKIVDKTLENIRFLGAIHCALPQARIIHVRRHPLDACWSLYKSDLVSKEFNYSYSLQHTGHYYHMYLRLMEHWRRVLPADVMYELDYEALVADQPGETRKLLNACNLPWDDNCLQFQKINNVVRTSSVAQVRQSIYTDAVQRWRHYENHLQPLMAILADDISHWPPN